MYSDNSKVVRPAMNVHDMSLHVHCGNNKHTSLSGCINDTVSFKRERVNHCWCWKGLFECCFKKLPLMEPITTDFSAWANPTVWSEKNNKSSFKYMRKCEMCHSGLCISFLLTLSGVVLGMPIAYTVYTDMLIELTQHSSKQWFLLRTANVIQRHGLL